MGGAALQTAADGLGDGTQLVHELLEFLGFQRLQSVRLGHFGSRVDLDQEAGGSSLNHVIKATVYLTDLGNFAKMNEVYAEYLGEVKPARSTVGIATLPRGAIVEIDLVATTR